MPEKKDTARMRLRGPWARSDKNRNPKRTSLKNKGRSQQAHLAAKDFLYLLDILGADGNIGARPASGQALQPNRETGL